MDDCFALAPQAPAESNSILTHLSWPDTGCVYTLY
jgi:hypothetical protein